MEILNMIKRFGLSPDEISLVEELHREHTSWLRSLTKAEIHAIRKYTKNSLKENGNKFFEKLNRMLDGMDCDGKEKMMLEKYADLISASLRKNHLQHSITCYRGSNYNPFEGYSIGEPFRYKPFLSTTCIKSRAFKKKYLVIVRIPAGTHAAYINDISRYDDQFEVLIDKGCIYRVVSRKGNITEVEVIA